MALPTAHISTLLLLFLLAVYFGFYFLTGGKLCLVWRGGRTKGPPQGPTSLSFLGHVSKFFFPLLLLKKYHRHVLYSLAASSSSSSSVYFLRHVFKWWRGCSWAVIVKIRGDGERRPVVVRFEHRGIFMKSGAWWYLLTLVCIFGAFLFDPWPFLCWWFIVCVTFLLEKYVFSRCSSEML